MKAKELKKESMTIDEIYERISDANSMKHFKYFIPHFVYTTESVTMQLIEDGFKVYRGAWDGGMTDCLIIEW
jgi:hypothetical protein